MLGIIGGALAFAFTDSKDNYRGEAEFIALSPSYSPYSSYLLYVS